MGLVTGKGSVQMSPKWEGRSLCLGRVVVCACFLIIGIPSSRICPCHSVGNHSSVSEFLQDSIPVGA